MRVILNCVELGFPPPTITGPISAVYMNTAAEAPQLFEVVAVVVTIVSDLKRPKPHEFGSSMQVPGVTVM